MSTPPTVSMLLDSLDDEALALRAAAQAITCCCADGGERRDDGRCTRCYGRISVIEQQDGGAA